MEHPEFKTIQNYFNSISNLSHISNMEASLMLYEQALKLDKELNYNEFQNQVLISCSPTKSIAIHNSLFH